MAKKKAIEEWRKHKDTCVEEYHSLLESLSKQNKKNLSKVVNDLHIDVFNEVDCLDCANCCKLIPPLINQEDVKRITSFLNIPISDFYKKHITIDEDGDMVLNKVPCIFLLSNNKCKVYEHRPLGCREYPLTDQNLFVENMEQHAINAKYCPAVFHVLERLKKLQ